MTTVVFYEKTGCAGNARQKALLRAAGHTVIECDIQGVSWTAARLKSFLAGLPVADWFNRSAPAIKHGEIVPEQLDPPTALGLLLNNPLLIRRPLMEVGTERRVGFDVAGVHAWIGLSEPLPDDNPEACRHGKEGTACRGHDHDHEHDADCGC